MRVLFVDDQPNVLAGLRRMLRGMRSVWEMDFVEGGEQALHLLDMEEFDVVVSDMRMPGMNGAQLLTEVMNRHPGAVRIILSGQAEADSVLQAALPAHFYLSKPCEADVLKSAVARALKLQATLGESSLKRIVSRVTRLPSVPRIYEQLQQELLAADASLRLAGDLIAHDVGMAAKTLQLVSSSFFGTPRKLQGPTHLASILGLTSLKSLIQYAGIFTPYEGPQSVQYSLEAINEHCIAVSSLASEVALDKTGDKDIASDAALAGMVYRAGQFIIAENLPEEFQEIVKDSHERSIPIVKAETVRLGASHCEIGAYLLGLWGVADTIIDAVANYANPERNDGKEFSATSAVMIADFLIHEQSPLFHAAAIAPLEAIGIGVEDEILKWREMAGKLLAT